MDSVGLYLDAIGQTPLLSAEEERVLSRVIQAGHDVRLRIEDGEHEEDFDRTLKEAARAKDRFIRANLRLVVSIAKRYPVPSSMELLDLVQEGNLGLEHAVDMFDWRKGFKFSTYATFWIRQAIGRSLDQKSSLIRLPGDRSASLRSALRYAQGDVDQLDKEHQWYHRISSPASLDQRISEDGDYELIDMIADEGPEPDEIFLSEDELQILKSLVEVLDPRAQYVLEERFGLCSDEQRSYREIGDDLGVTAEAARRLSNRSLLSIQDRVEETRLQEEIAAAAA